jgi:hypothetical protein
VTFFPKDWSGVSRYSAWVGVVVVAMGIGYLVGGLIGRWLAERMKALERAEKDNPGLLFAANYRGGIAVSDVVSSAASRVR